MYCYYKVTVAISTDVAYYGSIYATEMNYAAFNPYPFRLLLQTKHANNQCTVKKVSYGKG